MEYIHNLYEVYFDKDKKDFTNDNFSCFIWAIKKPTKRQALKLLRSKGALIKGYNLRFISEYESLDIDKELIFNYPLY